MKKSKHEIKANTIPAFIMVGPVTLCMVLLVAIPLIYVAVMSFCSIDDYYNVIFKFTLANYERLVSLDYLKIYARSLVIALMTTVMCIIIGYPFAYIIARTKSRRKKLLYMLVIIPFWTNSLIRIYGWRTFLGTNGWLNNLLQSLHIVNEPVDFLFHQGTTVLGMVYCLIPFMILPLYTTLSKLDKSVIEAASDLGADNFQTFIKVILPLSVPGIVSGVSMVFLPAMTNYVVLDMLYNSTYIMGSLIGSYFSAYDWHNGSMIALILLVIICIVTLVSGDKESENAGRGGLV